MRKEGQKERKVGRRGERTEGGKKRKREKGGKEERKERQAADR